MGQASIFKIQSPSKVHKHCVNVQKSYLSKWNLCFLTNQFSAKLNLNVKQYGSKIRINILWGLTSIHVICTGLYRSIISWHGKEISYKNLWRPLFFLAIIPLFLRHNLRCDHYFESYQFKWMVTLQYGLVKKKLLAHCLVSWCPFH